MIQIKIIARRGFYYYLVIATHRTSSENYRENTVTGDTGSATSIDYRR